MLKDRGTPKGGCTMLNEVIRTEPLVDRKPARQLS